MTKKRPKARKLRNWLAVHAHNRRGGHHGDQKKEASRKACRGRHVT
jgi:hypothetical protein